MARFLMNKETGGVCNWTPEQAALEHMVDIDEKDVPGQIAKFNAQNVERAKNNLLREQEAQRIAEKQNQEAAKKAEPPEKPPEKPPAAELPAELPNFEGMNEEQLRDFCRKHGIKLPPRCLKVNIIKRIMDFINEAE